MSKTLKKKKHWSTKVQECTVSWGGSRGAGVGGGGARRRRVRRVPPPRTRRVGGAGLALREGPQQRGRAAGGQRHPGERTHQQRHPGCHPTLPGARPHEDRETR
ncbi:unnamed protein product [Tetraodon nigroviridis]|uniref:(spotted green pufferfish) hypothetical protein n=1 Tax=Tetraodon nigroviridis TaxID=99883 RepID=Q4TEM8_TETNG|nr:unnamed protein product [Tetraodon nigroviridis]